jgi:hypothetical protein
MRGKDDLWSGAYSHILKSLCGPRATVKMPAMVSLSSCYCLRPALLDLDQKQHRNGSGEAYTIMIHWTTPKTSGYTRRELLQMLCNLAA